MGIDTPEKDGVCELERIRAKQATEFLRNYLYGVKKAFFYNIKWDKYGGRINANMIVNGVDINQLLVSQGHAIYYDGKAKKHDWCRE